MFLSFRGEDTRKNFTDHLCSGLRSSGLHVFKDDEKLERGKEIAPELLKAIEQSMFSVIVLSKNYASSSWCLEELAKIIECGDQKGQKIFPVFYDVDPSDVRKQTGSFQDDFSKHEEKYRENIDKVRKWRAAMTQVANLSGWTSKNRNESEIIEEIVQKIDYELSQTFSSVSEDLVGIDSRVRVVSDMLFGGQNDVRIIGICGMGGIGKSTIARVVYDKIRCDFEGSCFLANVREGFEKHGAVPLQEQLLSEILRAKSPKIWDADRGITEIKNRLQNRKVLVILDDVDTLKQLHFLAVDWKWFLPGSRIIITSRDKNLLSTHAVDGIYEAEELNYDDALVLLSRKAFKQDQPIEGYWKLCKSVLGHARGLPLAARVLGSSLCGRSMDFWESFIKRLNEIPNRDVMDVLKISFDGLEELEKKLFLDIACFFKGMNKDQVTRILNQCGFHANYGIQILQDKSLICVSNDTLSMHDLLQATGREVVRQESTAEPGRRSRLWASKDVFHVLGKNTGTEEIESIALDWANPEDVEGTMQKTKRSAWNTGVFSKMSRLRLLRIRNACFDSGPEYLSNELRFLEWRNYPSKYLPSSFQPENLVEVHLCYSNLRQLRLGNKILDSLKVIDLSYSEYLIKTPNFTGIPNLERLILQGCRRLSEVHSSIGHHNKLIYVNLMDCESLTSLPSRISGLNLLEELHLSGCSKLKEFPEIEGNKKCLRKLCLDQTSIEELPPSIQYLVGLISLSLKDCKKLSCLPSSINGLKSLKTLHLSGCSELENLPENFGQLECLNELDVSGTAIREPPVSIFSLKNLKILSFHGCAESSRSTTNIWQRLMFPLMPGKRATSTSLVLPSLSGLSSLTRLSLSNCNLGEGAVPNDIGYLSSLRQLDLSRNKFVSLPTSIDQLSGLKFLYMEDCKMLQSLPQLPPNLELLRVNGCTSLEKMQFSSNPYKFNCLSFCFINCWRLSESDCWNNMFHTLLRKCFQVSLSISLSLTTCTLCCRALLI